MRTVANDLRLERDCLLGHLSRGHNGGCQRSVGAIRKVIPPVALLLPGQVVCEGRAAVHGAGTAAALQLRQPAVLGGEGDGVRAAEGVLRQAPALPGATGPHGHHGQPDPVPPDVPPRVRKTHIHRQMATF